MLWKLWHVSKRDKVERGLRHHLFDPDTLDYDIAILRRFVVEYRGDLYLSFRDKKHYINVTK